MEEILWPTLIFGVLISLFGWTLYWAGLHVIGAFVGATGGIALGSLAYDFLALPQDAEALTIAVGGGLGAAFGVMLVRFVNYYLFFVIGAALGGPGALYFLAWEPIAKQAWSQQNGAGIGAMLVGATLCGFIFLKGRKVIVAIVGASLGAYVIATSLPSIDQQAVLIPSFIASLIVQMLFLIRFDPEDVDDYPDDDIDDW